MEAYRTGTVQYLCPDQYPARGGTRISYVCLPETAATLTILTEECRGIPQ
jgi:hypothetical protein